VCTGLYSAFENSVDVFILLVLCSALNVCKYSFSSPKKNSKIHITYHFERTVINISAAC